MHKSTIGAKREQGKTRYNKPDFLSGMKMLNVDMKKIQQ